jgi:hypothetical protein
MFNWLKKKPTPKRRTVFVYLSDGNVRSHKAMYRTIQSDGTLSLHDRDGGGRVVADYAAGSWVSMIVVEA